MSKGSTSFLRAAILAIGAGIALLGVLFFPTLWHVHDEYPSYTYAIYVVLITMYVTTIPYFIGLTYAWKLLNLIDGGRAFTECAVRYLKIVSHCALSISVLYIISLPFFYIWADGDDAPGLVVIGIVLSSVPMVAAVSVALLQRLLDEALTIKNENDMTV